MRAEKEAALVFATTMLLVLPPAAVAAEVPAANIVIEDPAPEVKHIVTGKSYTSEPAEFASEYAVAEPVGWVPFAAVGGAVLVGVAAGVGGAVAYKKKKNKQDADDDPGDPHGENA